MILMLNVGVLEYEKRVSLGLKLANMFQKNRLALCHLATELVLKSWIDHGSIRSLDYDIESQVQRPYSILEAHTVY